MNNLPCLFFSILFFNPNFKLINLDKNTTSSSENAIVYKYERGSDLLQYPSSQNHTAKLNSVRYFSTMTCGTILLLSLYH